MTYRKLLAKLSQQEESPVGTRELEDVQIVYSPTECDGSIDPSLTLDVVNQLAKPVERCRDGQIVFPQTPSEMLADCPPRYIACTVSPRYDDAVHLRVYLTSANALDELPGDMASFGAVLKAVAGMVGRRVGTVRMMIERATLAECVGA